MQEKPFYKNQLSGQWELRQSTQPSKPISNEPGATLEMVELQPADKVPRKSSPSRRDISLSKRNHLEDESSLTDSETIFTQASLSHDVTAIENSSTPAKSDSNYESNSPKQCPKLNHNTQNLETIYKPIDKVMACDKIVPNCNNTDEEVSEQNPVTSPQTVTSQIPNHSTTPISIASSISTTAEKM